MTLPAVPERALLACMSTHLENENSKDSSTNDGSNSRQKSGGQALLFSTA